MGHYDECREWYCARCGQTNGNCEHTKKMTKNERIQRLEADLINANARLARATEDCAELRLLIARLATRIGHLENTPPSREQFYGPIVPRWVSPTTIPPTTPFEVTCKNINPARVWPFKGGGGGSSN